jgi:S1-C subfamily serine protease
LLYRWTMLPARRAVSLIVLVLLVGAVAGCDAVESLIERGGEASAPSSHAPMVPVDPPDSALAGNAVVADAAPSVVKTRAVSAACQKVLEGTGFVVAPNRVMTGAHAVAGGDTFSISVGGQEHEATVVSFDPNVDIAILAVPDLAARPLTFADGPAEAGADAVFLGYPGGGPFQAAAARIREVIELTGPDIYRTAQVRREVYVIRGQVLQGNTGGPLIDLKGEVLGVVFGMATDEKDVGFVLTADEVKPQLAHVGDTQPVSAGDCMS